MNCQLLLVGGIRLVYAYFSCPLAPRARDSVRHLFSGYFSIPPFGYQMFISPVLGLLNVFRLLFCPGYEADGVLRPSWLILDSYACLETIFSSENGHYVFIIIGLSSLYLFYLITFVLNTHVSLGSFRVIRPLAGVLMLLFFGLGP